MRGIATAAWTLSLEICQACGGPGDPVRRPDKDRATLCARHREPGDVELQREGWRKAGDDGGPGGRLERIARSDELAAIMEARSAPEDHRGWPLLRAAGDPNADTLRALGAAGWTHLFRAGFAALLPLECAGVERPWRLALAKERLGRIRIHSQPVTPLHTGIEEMLAEVSAATCIFCGRPGEMLAGLDPSGVRQVPPARAATRVRGVGGDTAKNHPRQREHLRKNGEERTGEIG